MTLSPVSCGSLAFFGQVRVLRHAITGHRREVKERISGHLGRSLADRRVRAVWGAMRC